MFRRLIELYKHYYDLRNAGFTAYIGDVKAGIVMFLLRTMNGGRFMLTRRRPDTNEVVEFYNVKIGHCGQAVEHRRKWSEYRYG